MNILVDKVEVGKNEDIKQGWVLIPTDTTKEHEVKAFLEKTTAQDLAKQFQVENVFPDIDWFKSEDGKWQIQLGFSI